jgi:hypothetical protein
MRKCVATFDVRIRLDGVGRFIPAEDGSVKRAGESFRTRPWPVIYFFVGEFFNVESFDAEPFDVELFAAAFFFAAACFLWCFLCFFTLDAADSAGFGC